MKIEPIGIIHTPFEISEGMPIQSKGGSGIRGTIIVKDEYVAGLKDLDGFSHIYLIYWFHQSEGYALKTKPFLDDQPRGVFATRAPRRPNPIGLSVVKLIGIQGAEISIEGVDMLDQTPLLDIKPYIPEFDVFEAVKTGWIASKTKDIQSVKSDNRFNK
jgi:tRNA (adenine37-N6)-methyltransferase